MEEASKEVDFSSLPTFVTPGTTLTGSLYISGSTAVNNHGIVCVYGISGSQA